MKLNHKFVIVFLFFFLAAVLIAPIAKADSLVNLAPLTANWWEDVAGGGNTVLVVHDGHLSWSVAMPNAVNCAIDCGSFSVSPGDRVVFSAQIETSSAPAQSWAFIGLDFLDSSMAEYAHPSFGTSDATLTGGDSTSQCVYQNQNSWVLKVMDGRVAASYASNQRFHPGTDPPLGTIFVPAGFGVWMETWGVNGFQTQMTSWFSNPVLFIVHPGDPEYNYPTSYFTNGGASPTPTPTQNGGGGGGGSGGNNPTPTPSSSPNYVGQFEASVVSFVNELSGAAKFCLLLAVGFVAFVYAGKKH